MKIFRTLFWIFLLTMLFTSCKQLPTKRLSQNNIYVKKQFVDGNVELLLDNTVKCPVRFFVSSDLNDFQEKLDTIFPLVVAPLEKKIFRFEVDTSQNSTEKILAALKCTYFFGDPQQDIYKNKISLPFPKNWWFKIVQGYNGKFSHQSDFSRYALDFSLRIGDTVCVADDGLVVGLIEDYDIGGNHKKYRDYANFITVYHPHSGLYTQYVHLMHQSSFVKLGDTLTMGQPIALSGMTGFTSTSHLHFNVLIPTEEGIESTPIDFVEGYNGSSLKEKMKVVKK